MKGLGFIFLILKAPYLYSPCFFIQFTEVQIKARVTKTLSFD